MGPDLAVDGMVTIPRQEYESLRAEVAQYREAYGPIDIVQVGTFSELAGAEHLSDSVPSILEPDLPDSAYLKKDEQAIPAGDVLAILIQEDSDVAGIVADDPEMTSLTESGAIRHYGFKRAKLTHR